MNYIVMDLEWNQSNTGKEAAVKKLPFEIIDIGAVKLNSERQMAAEFNQLVKPSVYVEMHHVTGKIIGLQMADLSNGHAFPQVMADFLEWCGEDYIFCTWGSLDLVEIQRNMRYYGMAPLGDQPIRYLDVQKLFSIAFEDRQSRRTLEYAVDYLELPKEIPFHRAFYDAFYTAKVLERLEEEVLKNYSVDTFILPAGRNDEIHVNFDTYHKYISAAFADKAAALADREVKSTRCFLCDGKKNLKRKIKWFTFNGKHYYSVSLCPVHGYMKSKIRLKKSEADGIYVVKTSKFITEADLREIQTKKSQAHGRYNARKKH